MRANAKLSSLVFVRILCLLSALVIGPFIGATITTVVTFVAPETFGAAPVDASMALAMWAMFTFGAMFFGAPLATPDAFGRLQKLPHYFLIIVIE